MRNAYQGLPAAASVEQSIILAQRLILQDREREEQRALEQPEPKVEHELPRAA